MAVAADARATYDAFYRRSLDDPEGFWLEAAQRLDWTRQPERAFEQPDPPSFRWFPGGRTNMSVNALDRHVAAGRADATALITLDERGGRRALTYRELLAEVERVAAALRGLGAPALLDLDPASDRQRTGQVGACPRRARRRRAVRCGRQ